MRAIIVALGFLFWANAASASVLQFSVDQTIQISGGPFFPGENNVFGRIGISGSLPALPPGSHDPSSAAWYLVQGSIEGSIGQISLYKSNIPSDKSGLYLKTDTDFFLTPNLIGKPLTPHFLGYHFQNGTITQFDLAEVSNLKLNLYLPDERFVIAAIPEPSTWALMLIGFAGIGLIGHRRRSRFKALNYT